MTLGARVAGMKVSPEAKHLFKNREECSQLRRVCALTNLIQALARTNGPGSSHLPAIPDSIPRCIRHGGLDMTLLHVKQSVDRYTLRDRHGLFHRFWSHTILNHSCRAPQALRDKLHGFRTWQTLRHGSVRNRVDGKYCQRVTCGMRRRGFVHEWFWDIIDRTNLLEQPLTKRYVSIASMWRVTDHGNRV